MGCVNIKTIPSIKKEKKRKSIPDAGDKTKY